MARTCTARRAIAVGVILAWPLCGWSRGRATPFGLSRPASEPLGLHRFPSRSKRVAARAVRSGACSPVRRTGFWSQPWGCLSAIEDGVHVELAGAGGDRITKELHAGDPDLYVPYRPREDGHAHLKLARIGKAGARGFRCGSRGTTWNSPRPTVPRSRPSPTTRGDRPNELRLGRDVYGTATKSTTSRTRRREDRARLVSLRGEGRKADPGFFPARSARSRRLGQSAGLHRRREERAGPCRT